MKKHIGNFLLSAVVLMLTCSFVEAPDSSRYNAEDMISAIPVGGAYLLYAGKHGGEINKKDMEGQRELKVDGCAAGARVLQFTLEISKGGKTSSFQAATNSLTIEMLTRLKSLSSGDTFEFKQVRARLLDSNDVVDVHSKKFIVVDKGA